MVCGDWVEVSSDDHLLVSFGTTSELLFSDVPIKDCIALTALSAVTEGPAEANAANGEKSNENQDQMHDEPVISPIG